MANCVLIVDDEPENRQLLAEIVALSGHEATVAENGIDALRKIQERQPELIISDLQMPQMSGFELLSVLRRRLPEIPVIAISAEYEVAPKFLACDGFFQKGRFSVHEFRAKTSELLRTLPRPAILNGYSAPIWLPRGNDGYYTLTCTTCLRSSQVQGTTDKEHEEQRTSCPHCGTTLTYFLEGCDGPLG